MNWRTKEIFHILDITQPTEDEIQFVELCIQGGKTDNMERAQNICAFLNKKGIEQIVYDRLCAMAGNNA